MNFLIILINNKLKNRFKQIIDQNNKANNAKATYKIELLDAKLTDNTPAAPAL